MSSSWAARNRKKGPPFAGPFFFGNDWHYISLYSFGCMLCLLVTILENPSCKIRFSICNLRGRKRPYIWSNSTPSWLLGLKCRCPQASHLAFPQNRGSQANDQRFNRLTHWPRMCVQALGHEESLWS